MAKQSQQMSMNANVLGSIPNYSSSRVFKFLSDIAENTHSESTAIIDRKIAQLKAQRKKLKENTKKTKQRIQEQTDKFRLYQQEIDNLEMSITKLLNIREDDEMDMK